MDVSDLHVDIECRRMQSERVSKPEAHGLLDIRRLQGIVPRITRSSKPRSVCFGFPVQAVEAESVSALHGIQRFVIEKYSDLVLRGVFLCGLEQKPQVLITSAAPLLSPLQDVVGALMTTLLILRRHRPTQSCFENGTQVGNLRYTTRRGLAALVCVCHKYASHGPGVGLSAYVRHVYEVFFYPNEWPQYGHDWKKHYEAHIQAEHAVLQEPLHQLHTCNPLAEVEMELSRLLDAGKISVNVAGVFRGSAFFFFCACMFCREIDVLETLAEVMSMSEIGMGCVSLMLALWHVLGESCGGASVACGEVLHRVPYNKRVDQAAQILLRQGMAPHATMLRRYGPYRAKVHPKEVAHPVQRMLSPDNLERAVSEFLKVLF